MKKTKVKKNLIKIGRGPSKILVVLVIFLTLAQIFLANSLAIQGKEVSRMTRLRVDLSKEIEDLKRRSLDLSSLESIRQGAKSRLSMVDGLESFDYIDNRVALR